ncbi:MAG: O-antigen polymerase [Syntrophaceae bacterium]
MKISHGTLWGAASASIFALAGFLVAASGMEGVSFWLIALAGGALLVTGRSLTGSYANVLMIFLAFSLVYGLSGPWNALYGEGLPALFSRPYETAAYLSHYALAVGGMSLGIVLSAVLPLRDKQRNPLSIKHEVLAGLAVLFAFLASLFECVNFFRVGGVSSLGQGKAFYQSAVTALPYTLPSHEISLLAFGLIALACAFSRQKQASFRPLYRYVLSFILAILPLFLITVVLGLRGPLVAWFFIVLVGITYFHPIRRLSGRFVLVLLAVYFAMSFLIANRPLISDAVLSGKVAEFFPKAFSSKRTFKFMNPGMNEFGAAFGNFSEYVKSGDSTRRWGKTYVTALTVPVPSFLYPGEKPRQITYEFRDRFFPKEGTRGRIAGTAFSSVLEAYMNFGTAGVLGVYFLVGMALVFLERAKNILQPSAIALIYLLMLPLAQSFHRSSFGSVVNTLFWTIALTLVYRFSYMLSVWALRETPIGEYPSKGEA